MINDRFDTLQLIERGGYYLLSMNYTSRDNDNIVATREICDIVDLIRVSLYLKSIYLYTPGCGYSSVDNDTILWDFSHMSLEEMDSFIDVKLLDEIAIDGLHREERIKLYHCLYNETRSC